MWRTNTVPQSLNGSVTAGSADRSTNGSESVSFWLLWSRWDLRIHADGSSEVIFVSPNGKTVQISIAGIVSA